MWVMIVYSLEAFLFKTSTTEGNYNDIILTCHTV